MRVRLTETYLYWIDSLRDPIARARIQARVDRLVHGNPGAHRYLGGGVTELKIDIGPGYRVYFEQRGNVLTLLASGDKGARKADSRKAA